MFDLSHVCQMKSILLSPSDTVNPRSESHNNAAVSRIIRKYCNIVRSTLGKGLVFIVESRMNHFRLIYIPKVVNDSFYSNSEEDYQSVLSLPRLLLLEQLPQRYQRFVKA